jgi:hypothetical protein
MATCMLPATSTSYSYITGTKVYVTWLVNPSWFCVTKIEDEPIRLEHQNLIRKLWTSDKLERPSIKFRISCPLHDVFIHSVNSDQDDQLEADLAVGELVLAPSRAYRNQPLMRGKVLAILDDPNLGLNYKIEFIDIGHNQWVNFDDIFLMPKEMIVVPPMAIKCTLDKLHPNVPSGDGWSTEAKELFESLVEKDTICDMFVTKDLLGMTTKHVKLVAHIEGSSEGVNILNRLLFSGHGQLMKLRSRNGSQQSMNNNRMLLVRPLGRQSISWVQISEVYNPGCLYVQPFSLLGTDGENFCKLTEDMNENMPPSLWLEALPHLTTTKFFKGQMCALKSNDSNGVYRVIIEQISRTTRGAEVLLVDNGRRQLVDFKELVPLAVDLFVDPYVMAGVLAGYG